MDIEHYNAENGSNPTCAEEVAAYVTGWVNEMHYYGLYAGVYGSPYNAPDWVTSAPPDFVWLTGGPARPSILNISGLSNNAWSYHQRIHQYFYNTISPSWGGAPRVKIDYDFIDAAVFYPTPQLVNGCPCSDPCDPSCPNYAPGLYNCNGVCPTCVDGTTAQFLGTQNDPEYSCDNTPCDGCNSNCSNFDASSCSGGGCDICDPNCPSYDPGSCSGQCDICDPSCSSYDYCYCNPDDAVCGGCPYGYDPCGGCSDGFDDECGDAISWPPLNNNQKARDPRVAWAETH